MPQARQRAVTAQPSLPALTAQCDQIADYIALFDRLVEKFPDIPGLPLPAKWVATEWGHAERRAARQALTQWPQMQRAWATLGRPATSEQIRGATALLGGGFPHLSRVDTGLFARLLKQEIAELQPSVYVLARAVREVLRQREFLSIHAVARTIEQEQRRARRIDYLIRKFPLRRLLADAEARQRANDEQARRIAACYEEEYRAELRQRTDHFPPELCPRAWDDDELGLVGLTRAQVLQWRRQLIAEHPDMRRQLSEFERQAVKWRALHDSGD